MANINGNIVLVLVNPSPDANPEDLIYTLGGTGTTMTGNPGAIFGVGGSNNIPMDGVIPPNWYHGGYSPLDPQVQTYFDYNHTTISNSEIDIVSAIQEVGLFERNISSSYSINDITLSTGIGLPTTVKVPTTALVSGDRILIEGCTVTVPDGIYLITSKTTAFGWDLLDIDYDSFGHTPYTSGGTIKKYEYLWDEVFTTPLGLYSLISVFSGAPSAYEFLIANAGNSNTFQLTINDPNIIPQIDDFLVLQKINSWTINPAAPDSTTDGVNNVIDVPSAETYTFKITNVTVVGNIYTLDLDKSFAATLDLADPKWMLILLNRKDVTYKNLYEKTWEYHEVHREQLLGDPYEYTGLILPAGRMNYLYYVGSEYLGVKNLLEQYLPAGDSPFVILHYNDNIKDRIYDTPFTFEAHLPNILVQNESTPFILTNPVPSSMDVTGPGNFAPLHCKYGSGTIRYGYVFFDLRIILIDHAEVAMSMGYNTNRNYSLPLPTLPEAGNRLINRTFNNPLSISFIDSGSSPVKITTTVQHGLIDGTTLIIKDVQSVNVTNLLAQLVSINNDVSSLYYIKNVGTTGKEFELYWSYDDGTLIFSNPVTADAPANDEGTCYTTKLPQEYFITYRLISEHYASTYCAFKVPFNFRNTLGQIDNVNGIVDLSIENLSHLISDGIIEGFNADSIEIVIGKYVQDTVDLEKIVGAEDIKICQVVGGGGPGTTTIALKTGTAQDPHLIQVYKAGYNGGTTYDVVTNQPIYNGITIPETLFTGEGIWLLGNVIWQEHVKQYRLTFTVIIPAANWNGTENPSFEYGNNLMMDKLISEIAFILTSAQHTVNDQNGEPTDGPYIYAKITPVVKKTNSSDITLSISVDF